MRKQTPSNAPRRLTSIDEGWNRTDGSFRLDRRPRRRIRAGAKWVASKRPRDFTPEERRKFYAEHQGDFLVLPIERDLFGFGRVIDAETTGFYDLLLSAIPSLEEIERHRFLFVVNVPCEPVFSGRWRVLGQKPLPKGIRSPVDFYRHVEGSDFVEIVTGLGRSRRPYGGEDLTSMESVHGWPPWDVEERLRSHYVGRPHRMTERSKILPAVADRLRREYFERQKTAKDKK
jgi:hypothetical protein